MNPCLLVFGRLRRAYEFSSTGHLPRAPSTPKTDTTSSPPTSKSVIERLLPLHPGNGGFDPGDIGCADCFGHDYFDSGRERLLPRRRLLPLRPEDTGVYPKTLFPRVHPNPKTPILICPIFYNMPTIL